MLVRKESVGLFSSGRRFETRKKNLNPGQIQGTKIEICKE